MSVTYGVFTISRQDIVDLSRAIARCIPLSFMAERSAPVRIAVQGSYCSGKKIIADYGRSEVFGITDETLKFGGDLAHHNICASAFNESATLTSYGHDEHDEYVYGACGKAKQMLEVSFINLAWAAGYSKAIPHKVSDADKLTAHLAQRSHGGITYMHNCVSFITQPDITVHIESEGFTADAAGRKYHCCDVSSAIEDACDSDKHEILPEWCRFVQVTVHNEVLDQQGGISEMLKTAFGCVDASHLPSNVFTFFPDDDDTIIANKGQFPLRKDYAHMLKQS
jgi:hypothetical protein